MRIKGKYHLGVNQLIQHQILWTNIIGVVWQTVKRITAKEILGEKMLTLRWQEWTQFNEVLARVVLGYFVSYKSGLLLKKKGIEIWKMGKGVMSIPHRITRISENFTTSWLVQFDCTLLGQYLFQPEHQHVRSITDVTLKLVVFSMQSLVLLHSQ